MLAGCIKNKRDGVNLHSLAARENSHEKTPRYGLPERESIDVLVYLPAA